MRISIVTPTLDRRDYLARTGESILSQRPTAAADGAAAGSGAAAAGTAGAFDLEWIVVDGGSTDGSVAWLADRAAADPRVRYVSGPDRGQSDALNKGLVMAAGDVVAWLNADDLYVPGALAAVAAAFDAHPAAQWLVGRYEVIDAADHPIRPGVVRYKQRRLDRCRAGVPVGGTTPNGGVASLADAGAFRQAILRENLVPQPAVFWRRAFGHRVGPLDESLHWTMDYDLWLRMAALSPPLILDRLLARFRHHAGSKSGAFDRRQFDEGYAVVCRHAGRGDRASLLAHRINVEKIVWAYRALRVLGR